jgi:hypothetical protein
MVSSTMGMWPNFQSGRVMAPCTEVGIPILLLSLVKLAIYGYCALKEIDEFIEEHLEQEDCLPLSHKSFGDIGQGRNG